MVSTQLRKILSYPVAVSVMMVLTQPQAMALIDVVFEVIQGCPQASRRDIRRSNRHCYH